MGKPNLKFHGPSKVYMCGNDWADELGAPGGGHVYDDIELLKEEKRCWQECGIVELDVTAVRFVG